MANETGERPTDLGQGQEEKSTGELGKNPSRGLPGKIQRAETTAPDDADTDLIPQVGYIAYKRGVDPADVWADDEWRRSP